MFRTTLICISSLVILCCDKINYSEEKKVLNNIRFQFNKNLEKGESEGNLILLTPDWSLCFGTMEEFTKKDWANYLNTHLGPGVVKIIITNSNWIISKEMAVCISEEIWKWRTREIKDNKYFNTSVYKKIDGMWYVKHTHLSPKSKCAN